MLNKSWTLTDRQLCDCELIMDGSFHPLDSFMVKDDYQSVLEKMRLSTGELFPLPIILDVNKDFSDQLELGEKIILRNKEGFKIAFLTIESIWSPDLELESNLVYKTNNKTHPGVNYIHNVGNEIYLGGKIEKIKMPFHYDFRRYRLPPQKLKLLIKDLGWNTIIAFQTRNPLHRAHIEITLRAMKNLNANLLIHPVVGSTKVGDVDHFTRVRCYEHAIKRYPLYSVLLALLPLSMRMGGPREAILHAMIRKNYGCSHIIIGRDHAGPGEDEKGKPFYGPYDAQKMMEKHEDEIGIKMLPFHHMVYVPSLGKFKELNNLSKNIKYETISGTKLRNLLDEGKDVPEWFSYPEIIKELKRSHPPLIKKGFTIFFTGLSGSGKSTIANGLLMKLLEEGSRPVTLLDGDIVRTHLSSELGFSKRHREINVRRIGYVASEITKNGGVAICAPIAPYALDRMLNKELISALGGYVEVFISTSLKKCEERDPKGLYKMAREGQIKEFTGISDPYEEPVNPDIVLNSDGSVTPEELVDEVFDYLINLGYLFH